MTDGENKSNPEHIRQDLYRLALDWVYLHTHLPKPAVTENGRRAPNRTYGHPAQWASDKKAEITRLFYGWHNSLALARNETPPTPTAAEQTRVVKAWKYLEPRLEHLTTLIPQAAAFKPISDLHHQIAGALGFTAQTKQALPIPCPNCNLKTLARTISGDDNIRCEACRFNVNQNDYPALVQKVLEELTY